MSPYRLCYSLDILRFGNQRAKPIWGSKGMSEFDVMDEGVLSRKIKALRVNTTGTKDLAVVVKPLKGIILGSEAAHIIYVVSSQTAKFYESLHCLHCLI
jgi:hypothetical protein